MVPQNLLSAAAVYARPASLHSFQDAATAVLNAAVKRGQMDLRSRDELVHALEESCREFQARIVEVEFAGSARSRNADGTVQALRALLQRIEDVEMVMSAPKGNGTCDLLSS